MGMLTLRIDEKLEKDLAKLVEQYGQTKTYWVTEFIREGVAGLVLSKGDVRAIEKHKRDKARGIDRSIPWEVVVKEIDDRILAAENKAKSREAARETRPARGKASSAGSK
jgi:predicted DNA-binding protein